MRVRRLISDPKKGLYSLSNEDVASMIAAYLGGGDDLFASDALTEFMVMPQIDDRLEGIRIRIQRIDHEHANSANLDGLATTSGRAELSKLAAELMQGQ